MKLRHEWKHEISPADLAVLRMRLCAIAAPDPHGSRYRVRSLYFDTPTDRALREKLDGISHREKFRIRFYNGDESLIRLEKKSKYAALSHKESTAVSAAEVRALLDSDISWMLHGPPLVKELRAKMVNDGLRPRTIVEYTREAFVYAPGNVRVTLDYDIRTALSPHDLLSPDCLTVPAGTSPILLEVKWDEFLPDLIRAAVQLEGRRSAAFSKYAACRIYG